ncbi:MAG: hypothetical protein ACOC45_09195 [Alkalispirochaetaceae bacterium]
MNPASRRGKLLREIVLLGAADVEDAAVSDLTHAWCTDPLRLQVLRDQSEAQRRQPRYPGALSWTILTMGEAESYTPTRHCRDVA